MKSLWLAMLRTLCAGPAWMVVLACSAGVARGEGPGVQAQFAGQVRAAVEKSLPGILRGAANYPEHRECFSCHHQAQPLMALTAAKARGLAVEEERVRAILDFSLRAFAPEEKHARLGEGRGHRTTVIGYLLATLAAVDYPPGSTTSALVRYMLEREDPEGGWRDTLQRPPGQGSSFTVTAVALIGLHRYGDAEALNEFAPRIAEARRKALLWLEQHQPHDTEDRVFHLRGLVASGADAALIRASREALARQQRADGSWGQLPELQGDAYATGSALVALHEAGMAADDPVYLRGLHFLLATQQADGSWFVETRTKVVQPFFDNGDPGGKSQFISFSATNWAVLALLNAVAPARKSVAQEAGDTPRSWQVRAAEQARILSQVKWTPVADTMPNRQGGYFEKGKQYTGVPYSSVRSAGRYIGFDISLRTFLAAVENPRSVLYTEDLRRKVPNAAAYYGAVCSSFTSYALQCGIWEVSRRHGPDVSPGVVRVEPQSAQAVEVGDVIYTPHATATSGSHVEIVTAVQKDRAGRVTSVRVDESRPPTTKTTDRSPASFDKHLASGGKQLFRITDLDAWRGGNRAQSLLFPNPQADASTPPINRTLLLDLGDWVAYQQGQAVKFHVMDRDALGVRGLVIERGGEVVERVPLDGPGLLARTFTACGDYAAYVVRPDGSTSQACEFAVCGLDLRLPAESVRLDRNWEVHFTSDNIKIIAVYLWNEADSYGRHPLFLSEEDRRAGSITVPANLLKQAGTLQVWLIGEHPLGRLKVRKDVPMVK